MCKPHATENEDKLILKSALMKGSVLEKSAMTKKSKIEKMTKMENMCFSCWFDIFRFFVLLRFVARFRKSKDFNHNSNPNGPLEFGFESQFKS